MKANALELHVALRRRYATEMQKVYKKEIANYFAVAKGFIETRRHGKDTVLLGTSDRAKSLDLLVQAQAATGNRFLLPEVASQVFRRGAAVRVGARPEVRGDGQPLPLCCAMLWPLRHAHARNGARHVLDAHSGLSLRAPFLFVKDSP